MNLESAPLDVRQCVECLRHFPASEVVHFGVCAVCAECKPAAVAKLSAGVPLGWFWRKGRTLLVARTPEPKPFPRRCVSCNAEVGAVEGIDVPVLNVIREHEWKYYLCERHLRRGRGKVWSFWLLAGGAMVVGLIATVLDHYGLYAVSGGMLLAAAIVEASPPRKIRPLEYHTKEHYRFKRCGPAFLANFPERPGDR